MVLLLELATYNSIPYTSFLENKLIIDDRPIEPLNQISSLLLEMLHKMTLLDITYITRLNSTAYDTRDHKLLVVRLI